MGGISSACAAHTIMAFSTRLDAAGEYSLPPGIVPFPRGFAFGRDGQLFLASGIGPNGQGDNTVVAFTPGRPTQPSRLVADAELTDRERNLVATALAAIAMVG